MPTFAIGVDLGGTNLRIAAVDEHGTLLEKTTTGTQVARGRDFVINEMCEAIRAAVTKFPTSTLVGIGIGSGFFGEPVTVTEIVGFLIVVGGVTLVFRGSMVRRTPGVVPKEERPR